MKFFPNLEFRQNHDLESKLNIFAQLLELIDRSTVKKLVTNTRATSTPRASALELTSRSDLHADDPLGLSTARSK
jgi:hypothetical protein